ncbi:MAG: tetratricopeptide repeat protein [Gemmatimonadetes bacterium]|nr:tetratricopeptide repeat protein [Gemmatimonadota bacterium]
MPTDGQRTARAAFDAARVSFDRLTRAVDPGEIGTSLSDAWAGTENALRALAGSNVLGGVALVRELRQRNLLALDDAHALVDFHAAAERAGSDGYVPTSADVESARAAHEHLARVLAREVQDDPPRQAPYSGPISTPVTPRPSIDPLPPPPPLPTPARSNRLAASLVLVAVLAVLGAGGYYAVTFRRESSDLRKGRAAFAAGDRLTARNAFAAAISDAPTLAEPHIYLGRLARDEGDRATASAELRRAVELEPANYLAHRELAAYLLSTGQAELARSFYQRAIELNPADKVSLGYMACTLHRLGRTDLAVRFFQRAGPGEWDSCKATPPGPCSTPGSCTAGDPSGRGGRGGAPPRRGRAPAAALTVAGTPSRRPRRLTCARFRHDSLARPRESAPHRPVQRTHRPRTRGPLGPRGRGRHLRQGQAT